MGTLTHVECQRERIKDHKSIKTRVEILNVLSKEINRITHKIRGNKKKWAKVRMSFKKVLSRLIDKLKISYITMHMEANTTQQRRSC